MNSDTYKKMSKIIWHNTTVHEKGMQGNEWSFGKVYQKKVEG